MNRMLSRDEIEAMIALTADAMADIRATVNRSRHGKGSKRYVRRKVRRARLAAKRAFLEG